jgi:uncharacterized spore protein YtfJ
MNVTQILDQARDSLTVGRVYGQPIERDGMLLVPAATVWGGAGGGEGATSGDSPGPSGMGGGWGGFAHPAGAFIVDHGRVRWQAAVDVNRMILGGQIVFVVGLLVLRSIVQSRRRRTR